jgi:hypothetical protein
VQVVLDRVIKQRLQCSLMLMLHHHRGVRSPAQAYGWQLGLAAADLLADAAQQAPFDQVLCDTSTL